MLLSIAVRAPDAQRQSIKHVLSVAHAAATTYRSPCCHALRDEAQSIEPDALSRRKAVLGAVLPCAALIQPKASAALAVRIEEVQSRLIKCFEQDQYYVSGKLDRGIFEDGCVFTDPTINVTGALDFPYMIHPVLVVAAERSRNVSCRLTGSKATDISLR